MNTNVIATTVAVSDETWLTRFRAVKGFDTTVRVLGCTWFLTLAFAGGHKVFSSGEVLSLGHFTPAEWSALLPSICLILFYLTLGWLVLHRPAPAARTNGLLPSLAAFVATYLPWTIVLFAPDSVSTGQDIASSALLLLGTVLMIVVVLHLGRCFSIVPQARTLVRTGPYAIVRHPLYLVEEIALLGVLVQFFSPVTVALFLAQGALQVRRMFYEEGLLRHTLADYDDYARSTRRLIPYIW